MQFGPRRESFHAKVTWVHAQQQAGSFVDRFTIVFDARAIRRADFPKNCARALHDVRDPKSIANFDQLSARDYYFETQRQFIQRQIDGRCVVVHRDSGRAGQPFDQLRRMDIALAPRAPRQIVFKIRISGQGIKLGQRGAPEISVQHHAGGVDHTPQ